MGSKHRHESAMRYRSADVFACVKCSGYLGQFLVEDLASKGQHEVNILQVVL